MRNQTLPKLTSQGVELDTSPESFGLLRSSADVVEDATALSERMAEDGYLYLPGYLDRDLVLEARRSVTARLAEEGLTDPNYPADEAVAPSGSGLRFQPDLAHDNEPLHRLLYGGRMMEFYERFLGGPVRHYDFTWMRAIAPGHGTRPHGDVVFMGRGTHESCLSNPSVWLYSERLESTELPNCLTLVGAGWCPLLRWLRLSEGPRTRAP